MSEQSFAGIATWAPPPGLPFCFLCPPPLGLGNMVFHKAGPWCQKGRAPLHYSVIYGSKQLGKRRCPAPGEQLGKQQPTVQGWGVQ